MKTIKLFIAAIFFLLQLPTFAQVQIDHEVQLTGTGTNARINGIKSVIDSLDAASAQAVQSGSMIYATATGSSNNFSISISPPISAYQKGMAFNLISNQNITGPATLQVNNLAAITIKKNINQNLSQCDIQNGQVVSVLYDGANFQMISSPMNVTGLPAVSIAANPSGTIVQGTSVTFTATPTNGGSGPTYQWIVNGGNVGTGGTTYTTSTLNNGDAVSCVMTTSTPTCGSPATSNTITAVVSSSLLNNLVAYWKMDESSGNPVDASGNGHTLTNNNSCPFDTAYGVINNGVNFNGTNQDLTCSDAGFPAGSSDRTFAFWINFTSTPSNNDGILTYGTVNNHKWACIQWVNGGIYFSGYGDDASFASAYSFSIGKWYHVAFTISNTGSTIAFYVNGVLVATSTGHSWSTVLGGTFYLSFEPVISLYCASNMDEVGVWSRALSTTEISALYNGGAGLQYPF